MIDDQYDCIVIGAGIGGLLAANFLAKANIKTLLIEKHKIVGGYFQGQWRQGFFFDYGTQSNEIKGAILPALKALGLDHKVEFNQCHHRFVSPHGLDLNLKSLDQAKECFQTAYPESHQGIHDYFEYYKEVTNIASLVNIDGIGSMINCDTASFMPDYHSYWKTKPYYSKMMEYDAIPSWKQARKFLGRSRVSRILSHFGYRNQSVLATGIFWHLWMDDYYYNTGGKQSFVDMLAESFTEAGGAVSLETSAEEIIVVDNEVKGVRLGNGRIIGAKSVISNADLRFTLEKLLNAHPLIYDLLQKVRNTPVSEAFFSAFIGTDIPVEELRGMLNDCHHTWYFPTNEGYPEPFDLGFHRSIPLEISAPVLHDSNLAKTGSQVVIQTFTFFNWMQRWDIKQNGARSKSYTQLKDEVAGHLIENASYVIPNLKDHITYKMSATPLTHERFTGNNEGATAGWTWNPKRTLVNLTDQKITTPIHNLFFAGHWVLYPGGLLTASLAGKIAADLVISKHK